MSAGVNSSSPVALPLVPPSGRRRLEEPGPGSGSGRGRSGLPRYAPGSPRDTDEDRDAWPLRGDTLGFRPPPGPRGAGPTRPGPRPLHGLGRRGPVTLPPPSPSPSSLLPPPLIVTSRLPLQTFRRTSSAGACGLRRLRGSSSRPTPHHPSGAPHLSSRASRRGGLPASLSPSETPEPRRERGLGGALF